MMTRRTAQRQLLMTPSPYVRNAFLYCLGFSANRWGIQVHCFSALGNHQHDQFTDPWGFKSKFAEDFHKYFAKVMNAHRGRWENFFDNGKPSFVELVDADAARRNMTYILSNPLKHALVNRSKLWPGAWSRPLDMAGSVIKASRPSGFFLTDGPMPDEVEFTVTPSPFFADMKPSAFIEMVSSDLKKEERKLRKEHTEAKRPILGVKAIRRQDPLAYPNGREPRRKMNPRVKTRDKWRRIAVLQRNKQWHEEYRDAFLRNRAGEANVLFPYGTWWFRIYGGVRCRPPPKD